MERRPSSFLFTFIFIFLGLLLLQRWIFPQPAAPIAGNAQDQAPAAEMQRDDAQAVPGNEAPANDGIGNAEQESDQTPPPPKIEPRFVTLGSLDPAGNDRYLVTFTTGGAAIVRVELNARNARGRFLYRDLDHFGGYLGKLELRRHEKGLAVSVVGPGTPAELAGVQVGDVIQLLDNEPLFYPGDLQAALERRRADAEITLHILRPQGDQFSEHDLRVQLTDQPLELLRPETDLIAPGSYSPPSLQTALLKVATPYWEEIDAEMLTGNWDVDTIDIDGQPGLEFSYQLTDHQLQSAGLNGPIRIIKRYWLPHLADGQRTSTNSRTFHINFQLVIENQSNMDQVVGLQLNGLTGTPTEGWWYQHKIHASSTAIGYTAGSRDVVCSTTQEPYRFLSGPEIVTNTLKPAPAFQYLLAPLRPATADEVLNYVGVDTQYFHAALLPAASPTNSRERYTCYSILGGVVSSEISRVSFKRRLTDCSFFLYDKLELPARGSFSQQFDVFVGPKEKQLLEQYGLDDNRTFGWFAWLSKTLLWLLRFFYNITFQFSYGLAIIMLTVFVRVLMIPWGRKAAANAQMMQLLAPEMKSIAEKYKDEPEKRIVAQRELFRRHKYNPFSGCLIVLLQLPIFMGLYRGLSVDIALRDQPLIPGMRWCSNLAAPDQFAYWKNWMPNWLGDETGWFGPWFNLLPIATIVLFLVQQKMFMPPATDDQQRMTQRMMTWMMIFLGFMFFKVPSGLCVYFITSSIWSILERKLLPPVKLSEDKVNALKSGSGNERVPTNAGSPEPVKRDTLSNKMVSRFREMVEGKGKPQEQPLNAEEKKKLDRERRRKLRERES